MNPRYNRFYIPLAIFSIIVLILHKIGPFSGQLRLVGFALFTILCVALVTENRRSKGKALAAIFYFLFGLVILI
ncbi:hypothetical protein J7I80_04565 [Bacillus sp. ISL-41]|uniref:hypothetical protein n=1 Tax=Bacillus sp. ISL-41 TaxID=2819127 RepID=UPI001BE553A1|nr:hypothetical protein [Bacillus sp. ISL-41]MBT2641487.1 hypothetical protein [Bacillus sp. ISL-41]